MIRTDYWNRIVDACTLRRDDIGAFPPPTMTTVAAAEIVKLLLQSAGTGGAPYEGTMACSVVQLHDLVNGQQTFVVAFSGYHPTLKLDLQRGATELAEAFTSLNKPVVPPPRFWYRTAAPSSYVPLHKQTQDYFKKNLLIPKVDGLPGEMEGIDVTQELIAFAHVQPYLDFNTWKNKVFEGRKKKLLSVTSTTTSKEVPAGKSGGTKTIQITENTPAFGAESGAFSYAYRGTEQRLKLTDIVKNLPAHIGTDMYTPGESFGQSKAAIQAIICGMLTSFLALRMDLIVPKDVPATVKSARAFIRELRGINEPKWTALATYLEQVLISPKLTAEQLDMEVTAKQSRETKWVGPLQKPEPESNKLTKRQRGVLKDALKKKHWKDVPTQTRVTELELQQGIRNLTPTQSGDLVSARNDLVAELRDDAILGDLLPQIWGAAGSGPNGQYCAEPKAFDHVRNGTLLIAGKDEGKARFVIVGQLAVWYSGSTPAKPFSMPLLIIGPENNETKSESGGYMLPCSSCAARSGIMMEGVVQYDPDGEAPTLFTEWEVQLRNRCVICGKNTARVCGRCSAVFYCDKPHQALDWRRHKAFCAPLTK